MQAFDLEGAIEEEKNVDEELRKRLEILNSLSSDIMQSDGLRERTIENLNQVVDRRNESVAGKFRKFIYSSEKGQVVKLQKEKSQLVAKIQAFNQRQESLNQSVSKIQSEISAIHNKQSKRLKIYHDAEPPLRLTRPNRREKKSRKVPTIYKPRESSTPKTVETKRNKRRQRRGLRNIENMTEV